MSQKSYGEKNALYLIPTPIGNMDDITLRTIDILKLVDVIYCEDTRITSLLLKKLEISKKLISSNEQTETKSITSILNYLSKGKNVGIVTDRGTPVISDPGYRSVSAVINAGYSVIPLPGANALIPALIASGLEPLPFTFYGFLNSKSSKRKTELKKLISYPYTLIFYESPHRIIDTMQDLLEVFGNRNACVAREISKVYEEFYRGTLKSIIKEMENGIIKGEIVLVVEGNKLLTNYDGLSILEHVNLYIDDGNSEKDSIKMVAKDRKINKSEIYKEYHIRRK